MRVADHQPPAQVCGIKSRLLRSVRLRCPPSRATFNALGHDLASVSPHRNGKLAGAYTVIAAGPHQSPPQLHLVRQRRSQAAKASLHLALHLCQASSGSRPRSRTRAQRCEQ